MTEYFPKPPSDYKNIKVKTDLTNYTTKKDTNDITHVDKLDIDKLVPVPLDLSKLSNVECISMLFISKKSLKD